MCNVCLNLTAMTHMDKLRVFGKAMRVMLSKHQTVQLPKEGQPDAGLTRLVHSVLFHNNYLFCVYHTLLYLCATL